MYCCVYRPGDVSWDYHAANLFGTKAFKIFGCIFHEGPGLLSVPFPCLPPLFLFYSSISTNIYIKLYHFRTPSGLLVYTLTKLALAAVIRSVLLNIAWNPVNEAVARKIGTKTGIIVHAKKWLANPLHIDCMSPHTISAGIKQRNFHLTRNSTAPPPPTWLFMPTT